MKVRNFKGRINQRRIRALGRLVDNAEERQTLVNRIMPQEQAEAMRTKKDRGKGKEK